MAENLIKKALHYELTDIVVDTSRLLYRYFSEKEIDADKEEYYSTLNDTYVNILNEELKAEKVMSKIKARITEAKTPLKDIVNFGKDYFRNRPSLENPIPSFNYYYIRFIIKIYLHEFDNDFEKVKEEAKKAYEFLSSKHYDHIIAKQQFLLHIIHAHLQLNRVHDSIKYQDQALEMARDGSLNWFITLELKILTSLGCEKYKQAHGANQTMNGHRNYIYQPLNRKVRWTLIGLYVQFLRQIELIHGENPSTQSINHHFKFLDENKSHLKDLEVPYIIAQLLFNICDRDYDAIESKIYSLKNYCNTYLKKASPNFRSNCFIKMLLQVPLNNFHPRAVERKAMPYQRKLEAEAFKIDHERVLEIIPYEKLWAIILNHLEAPRRQRTSEYSVSDWNLGKRGLP